MPEGRPKGRQQKEEAMDPAIVGVRFRWIATVFLGSIAAGGAIDLVLDAPTTIWTFHVLFELGMLSVSLVAVAYLWLGWQDADRALEGTRAALAARGLERDAWRARAETLLRGLGEEIDRQFRAWDLTPVEGETALLLLKGFGHKEIAVLQEKSERTVRQHAVAVYRKSGLAGRAQLSAYFLEDLLLPDPDSPAEAAGIKPGDVITSINGERIHGDASLRNAIGILPSDSKLAIRLLRDGKPMHIDAHLSAIHLASATGASIDARLGGARLSEANDLVGGQEVTGVRVNRVAPDSRAARNGLKPGDLIIGVNQLDIDTLRDLKRLLAHRPNRALLSVVRGSNAYFVSLN